VAAYTVSLALLPLNPEAYLQRGLAYDRLRDSRKAIPDSSAFLALVPTDHPRCPEALLRRASNYHAVGDDAAAVADLDRLATLPVGELP
jgi:hypothetical protein